MKVRIIGNSLAVQGFQLAGILGWIAESTQQVQAALEEAKNYPDLGIVLVTSDAVKLAKVQFSELILHSEKPLFVEIPGRNPDPADLSSLREIVNDAVGVKS
ncbi:MAG: ATP synthase subunit F [Chloroflexi bacterium]|nr:ATP synthase subunit F [Chloroflexota bacterium]